MTPEELVEHRMKLRSYRDMLMNDFGSGIHDIVQHLADEIERNKQAYLKSLFGNYSRKQLRDALKVAKELEAEACKTPTTKTTKSKK